MTMEALRAEFEEKGVVRVPQLLNEEALQACRSLFDEAVFAPSVLQSRAYRKSEDGQRFYYNDTSGHQGDHKNHQAFFAAHPEVAKSVCEVLGTKSLWYCDHEVWYKPGTTRDEVAKGKATPYHQDTLVMPARGRHMANLWITFEAFTPKRNALHVVPGSHKGPVYKPLDGLRSERNVDLLPTIPKRPGAPLPKVPEKVVPSGAGVNAQDIIMSQEDRQREMRKLEAMPPLPPSDQLPEPVSWDITRGDVMLIHPHSLHGAAPLSEDHPQRHTIVLRVFGDDCVYSDHAPAVRMAGDAAVGDHFSRASPSQFFKICGPAKAESAMTSKL